jgi:chromosomal replication initiator protein
MNTWERALGKIESRVNARHFSTWFRPTQFHSENEASLTIRVPNNWYAEWLRSNYLSVIQQALSEIERPGIEVAFLPAEAAEGGAAASVPARRDTAQGPRSGTPSLNPRYTFGNFIVSSCNQFAHAAARAVAERSRHARNPLYLYGGVGLGKTHLMQAIGNHLAAAGSFRMCYVSAEHFMNELINAIRFEKTLEFKDRYRGVDLLLIDDIQFLAGKDRTQEEFFHTFNALYDSQRQIVITSDCAPREIPTLEERLRSRFEWGLIADIQPPDLETKVAILQKKAEGEGIELADDVALFIAGTSKTNIRELEGALIRVVAYASMGRREITLELAQETLKELRPSEPPKVTLESIQKLVANYYNMNVSELKARNSSPQIVLPRQIAMYLCKRLTALSLPDIGRRFGGKHHTTVLHAVQKIDKRRRTEREFDRLLESFAQSLRS